MSSGAGSGGDGPNYCSRLPQRCDDFFGATSPCLFHGDPDIAGIGIIIAFLVSAWLAFAVVLYSYFCVDNAIAATRMNQLDRYLIQSARSAARSLARCFGLRDANEDGSSKEHLRRMHLRRTVVKRTLLSLSDQQLVTGIAVMSVGFAQVSTLTEYHFHLLSCFAWLSFTVYQCAAVVIESVFRMSRFMAIWRAIWIILMLCLIFATTLATYHDYWLASFGTPSVCVYQNIPGNYTLRLSGLILVILFAIGWGGLDIIYGFFPSRSLTNIMKPLEAIAVVSMAFMAVPVVIYQRLHELEQEPSPSIRRFMYRFGRILCYPFAVLMAAIVQLLTSRMVDLLRVWTMGLFYSSYIFVVRNLAPARGLTDSEDGWAFGQAVPVFMLLLPAFGIIEAYLEEKSDDLGGLTGAIPPGDDSIAMHKLAGAGSPRDANETYSSLTAQMRTIGPSSINKPQSIQFRTGQTRGKETLGADSSDQYSLISPATHSSTDWATGNQDHERDLESRPPILDTQPTSSSRFREWRDKWPILDLFATFEREHYQNAWFGPLMIVLVLLLFGAVTAMGFTLLIVTS